MRFNETDTQEISQEESSVKCKRRQITEQTGLKMHCAQKTVDRLIYPQTHQSYGKIFCET